MVAVGESTGRLDDLLEKIAAFYTREVDGMVANLVELIQPALMVVIGIVGRCAIRLHPCPDIQSIAYVLKIKTNKNKNEHKKEVLRLSKC